MSNCICTEAVIEFSVICVATIDEYFHSIYAIISIMSVSLVCVENLVSNDLGSVENHVLFLSL